MIFFPKRLSKVSIHLHLLKIAKELELIPHQKIKIIIGASGTRQKGWIATEKEILDVTNESDWSSLFNKNTISSILAEHVLEHLNMVEIITCLKCAKKYLRKGGIFRIAVPDGYHPSRYVIDLTKVNGLEPGADDHKVLLNIDTLKDIGKQTGFKIYPVEYFDKKGIFHSKKYTDKNGRIDRSSKYYLGRFTNNIDEYRKFINSIPDELRDQFALKKISYTSLIIDLMK